MAEQQVMMPGSIGASQPGLAQIILDAELDIAKIGLELQGYRAVIKPNGALSFERLENANEFAQTAECAAWLQGKLRAILSKTVSLSKLSTEREMDMTAWSMDRLFVFELISRWHEFNLDKNKFLQLCALYFDYTHFAVRHPLGAGIRGFLSTSTSETYTRMDQKVTEQQEKRGLRGLLGL